MNYKFEGKYFDGLSSAFVDVSVNFNDSMNKICFQKENGDLFFWDISEIQFNQYSNLLEIRNKYNLDAILKIDNENFTRKFFLVMKKNKGIDIHTRILNAGFLNISIIAICLIALFSLGYFYILPPVAEKSAAMLPESFDNYIGDIFMKNFIDEKNIDNEKTKNIQNFAEELYLGNTKPLGFTVIKSSEVNAFALPNGQIIIYTAILDKMQNYDQLVALLGHEVSHINNRHSIKILCKNLAGYMMISLLFSDVNGIMSLLAENAQQLHSLSYSREFEEEADKHGLQILINNNTNPYGMIKLFEKLEEEESEFNIPKIISSHPLTNNRKKYIQKLIIESDYTVKSNNKLATIFETLRN